MSVPTLWLLPGLLFCLLQILIRIFWSGAAQLQGNFELKPERARGARVAKSSKYRSTSDTVRRQRLQLRGHTSNVHFHPPWPPALNASNGIMPRSSIAHTEIRSFAALR
jgi:hypothetical protein